MTTSDQLHVVTVLDLLLVLPTNACSKREGWATTSDKLNVVTVLLPGITTEGLGKHKTYKYIQYHGSWVTTSDKLHIVTALDLLLQYRPGTTYTSSTRGVEGQH